MPANSTAGKKESLFLMHSVFHEGNTLSVTTQALFSMKYHALFGIKTTLGTSPTSTKTYLMELVFASVTYRTIISINTESTSLTRMHKHIKMNVNTRLQKHHTQLTLQGGI